MLSFWRPSLPDFGDILLACHDSVYRYARTLCREPATAEELVQETYGRALGARKKPHPPTVDNVRPWLFVILRNHWYNQLRGRRLDAAADDALGEQDAVSPETPDTILSRRYLQSEVRDAIDSLPETLREVIVLREIEEFSYAEIAQLMGCPVGTVMSRLARGRGMLRHSLARTVSLHSGVER